MKSYFFVPANNTRYLEKIDTIKSDEIVLELEDGIPAKDLEYALKLIETIDDKNKYWIRPETEHLIDDITVLELVLRMGFKKIILPKIKDFNQFKLIYNLIQKYKSVRIILLVEHPKLLLELENIVSTFSIEGLAFGLHDFAKVFGVKSNHDLFFSYSKQIILIAKAYDLIYIDSPSMNVSGSFKKKFKGELMLAKEIGCDGKFIIHPNQMNWFNEIDLYTAEEVNWAKSIYSKTGMGKYADHETIILDGQIIEKPHINLANKILKWYDRTK